MGHFLIIIGLKDRYPGFYVFFKVGKLFLYILSAPLFGKVLREIFDLFVYFFHIFDCYVHIFYLFSFLNSVMAVLYQEVIHVVDVTYVIHGLCQNTQRQRWQTALEQVSLFVVVHRNCQAYLSLFAYFFTYFINWSMVLRSQSSYLIVLSLLFIEVLQQLRVVSSFNPL